MKFACFCLLVLCSSVVSGQDVPEIGLRTGETLYPQSILYKERLFKEPVLVINEGEKISLSLVKYYQTSEDYYRIEPLSNLKGVIALSNSDVQLRRVERGAITLYKHTYTTTSMASAGAYGAPMMNTSTVINYYYEDEWGELEFLNEKSLEALVKDDPVSLSLIKKQKKHKLVNIGFYVVGGIVTLIGILNWANDVNATPAGQQVDAVPPAAIVGLVIMAVPTIRNLTAQDKYSPRAIVAQYNGRHRDEQ